MTKHVNKKKKPLKQGVDFDAWGIKFRDGSYSCNMSFSFDKKRLLEVMVSLRGEGAKIVRVKFVEVD